MLKDEHPRGRQRLVAVMGNLVLEARMRDIRRRPLHEPCVSRPLYTRRPVER